MSRRIRRLSAIVATVVAVTAGAVPLAAVPAAAETDSSLTVPVPASWYGAEGGHLTVSKTKNLVDGETVTISGLISDAPDAGGGRAGAYMQTATAYGAGVFFLTDTAVALGQKSPATVPDGWTSASRIDAEVVVQSAFTTRTDNASPLTSPPGVAVDCKVEQCYLALTQSSVDGADGPFGAANFPWAEPVWVPITFEGGNAELIRDVAPAITAQPADAAVDAGDSATFHAGVAGQPAPTLQWQTSVDDGASWTDLANRTDATLTVATTIADDGRLYRAVATNRQATATTRSAALTVATSAPSGEDDGRWSLGQPGSWASLTQFSGLTDGQQITIEAEYVGRAPYDPWPAEWAMPVSQAGFAWPNDRWENGYDPNTHREAKAEWVDAAPLGDDRYRGSVTYTVNAQLPDPESGKTFDCRVTQCYLVVGGGGRTADDKTLSNIAGSTPYSEPAWVDGEYSPNLSYLVWGGDIATDYNNSVAIPLFFEGGALVPQERSAPIFTTSPADAIVEENNSASFTVAVAGLPDATITWQRSTDRGVTWITVGGATGASYAPFATPALNGVQYRAVAENALGRTASTPATLTVSSAGDTAGEGVVFEWTGSAELQSMSPARTPNYFSAGVSDGTKATYQNVVGDAKTLFRRATGAEQLTTFDTRSSHISEGGQQIVRLSNGHADLDARGAGTISWDADWTVNFYGGLVPFTFSDPELTIDADGSGTLVADLTGYAASMADPQVKEPLEPVTDVVVSTFSSVVLADGTLSVVPDYAGVEFDLPEGSESVPQVRDGEGWGAWPQSFVDFHFLTGLTSYWYTSGGTADPLKAPLPFVVSNVELPVATIPAAPDAPAVTVTSGNTVDVSWAAPGDGGSSITGYTVVATATGQEPKTVDVDGGSLAATVSDLDLGTEYAVTVTASNAVGAGPASAATVVTTIAAPSAPDAPEVAAERHDEITVTWTAPESDGGSPVTGYRVALTGPMGTEENEATAAARTMVFAGLGEGEYTAVITAVTAVAASDASPRSAAVRIAGAKPTVRPALLSDADFTADSAGGVSVEVSGRTAVLSAGAAHAGRWVGVSVHSSPEFLGWFLADASGDVSLTLPEGLAPGVHRLAAYAADGTVIGYASFVVAATAAPGDTAVAGRAGALPATGSDADPAAWTTLGLVLLLTGVGAVVLSVRRRAAR